MVIFLYEIALWLLALIMLPKMLYQWLFKGKYQSSFKQRFGIGFPTIDKQDRPLIWVHAVSVGETKAVAALVKLLKSKWTNPIILISSVTETGHTEAKRSIPFADYHVFMPFDLNWVIGPLVKRLKPNLVIISEGDLWFHFLRHAKQQGATVAIVNGKISERSLSRFKKIPLFSRALYSQIDLFCLQNQIYQTRFLELGIPNYKIVVTGNMKFDEEYPKLSPEELLEWKKQLGISSTDRVFVVGSTHDPEEKIVIEALKKVWVHHPELKVLIVPRHPERFDLVAKLLEDQGVRFARYSAKDRITGNESVLLVDAMGVLRKCYQLADLALVAGSYTEKVGGHNIIEPCWYGVPVLFGPHMHTQMELVQLVKQYDAGLQVPPEDLEKTLLELLGDSEKRALLGKNGSRMVTDMKGATVRTWNALRKTDQTFS